MIRPQNDDGVIPFGRGLERIQQSANVIICVSDGRQVRLDGINFPIQLGHVSEFFVWLRQINARFRNVIEILLPLLLIRKTTRQDNLILGIHVVILLGHHPRQMRLDDAACQEQ